jgi:hypothetical protein
MLGKIMQWMAEIEEEGLGNEEYVPEDGMATLIDVRVEEPQRTVFVSCSKSTEDLPESGF